MALCLETSSPRRRKYAMLLVWLLIHVVLQWQPSHPWFGADVAAYQATGSIHPTVYGRLIATDLME
jgi:hypothetical protein